MRGVPSNRHPYRDRQHRGEAFVDQGQQRYEEQQRERSIAALKRRAAALGFQINPTPVPA